MGAQANQARGNHGQTIESPQSLPASRSLRRKIVTIYVRRGSGVGRQPERRLLRSLRVGFFRPPRRFLFAAGSIRPMRPPMCGRLNTPQARRSARHLVGFLPAGGPNACVSPRRGTCHSDAGSAQEVCRRRRINRIATHVRHMRHSLAVALKDCDESSTAGCSRCRPFLRSTSDFNSPEVRVRSQLATYWHRASKQCSSRGSQAFRRPQRSRPPALPDESGV